MNTSFLGRIEKKAEASGIRYAFILKVFLHQWVPLLLIDLVFI